MNDACYDDAGMKEKKKKYIVNMCIDFIIFLLLPKWIHSRVMARTILNMLRAGFLMKRAASGQSTEIFFFFLDILICETLIVCWQLH